jgi:hypothetical protein
LKQTNINRSHKLTVNLFTYDAKNDEFVVYLVEDGPWPIDEATWKKCLSSIQGRIFDAIDSVVDGHLAEKYPECLGKRIRVQIDSPSGLPPALTKLVAKVREHIGEENEYHTAITKSRFIGDLRITTGHEMGRFGAPS